MKEDRFFYLDELHLPIVLRDIIFNIWVVILAVLTGCMGIFTYVNIAHKPQYMSEATFVVSPRSNGSYVSFYSSLNTANEMAEVFSEIFTSDVLKREIREDLNEPGLSFTINVNVAEGTNILCVSATANSPKQAHSVMLSLIDNYGNVSEYLFGGVVLDILKSPQVTTTPINPPNIKKMLVLCAVVMAFLTTVLIAIFSIFRKTIKTRESAKRRMEESPLGILLKVKNNKMRVKRKKAEKTPLLITNMATGFRYVETMLQISHKVRHKMHKNKHSVLLVTSCAENEGKTTIAANLALYMEKHGHRVALVDFDLRHPSVQVIFSGHSHKYELSDCLNNGIPNSLGTEDRKMEIISCDKPVNHPDIVLTSENLQNFISDLRKKVDYIILDSAPFSVAADTGMILQHADAVLMVVRQDWVPYNLVRDVADELDAGKAEYLGYVLNNYRRSYISHLLKSP